MRRLREPPHDAIWHEARMAETAAKREAYVRVVQARFDTFDRMPELMRKRAQEVGLNRAMQEGGQW